MPGIAGMISKSRYADCASMAETMLSAMSHEEFYAYGKYCHEGMGVYVGWGVHKDSFCDCLPICNETGDVIIVFYGENHADRSYVSGLKRKGHELKASDASYLVHLYEDDEAEFFRELNGWYCGIVMDLRKKKAILFNDRYGMQRLYYHEGNETFYFASEAKSILSVKPELKCIPDRSLAELVCCECVLENRSLFKGISVLPGGACWEFLEDGKPRKHSYFDPSLFESQHCLESGAFFRQLQDLLREILPQYFEFNGRIAFSLTGGLDTRTILSNMSEPFSEVHCYTHGGAYRDSYDVTIARKVAKLCGLSHETLRIDETFVRSYPALAEKTIFVTDGYMDLNGTPSLYLHKKARNIGNVRLTGNFGDQVLSNARSLRASRQESSLWNHDFSEYFEETRKCLGGLSSAHPLSFFLFKQAPWYDYSRFSLEQSQLVQRSPFMDNELVRLLYRAPSGMLSSEDVRMRLIKEGNQSLASIPTDRGFLGNQPLILAKGLHLYREVLLKLEYYYSYGMPQWLAKVNNALRWLYIEEYVLERSKYYNMRRLFRDELAEYVMEVLLDNRTLKRPFINGDVLKAMVISHTRGQGNYTSQINRMLSIELGIRSLIEANTTA